MKVLNYPLSNVAGGLNYSTAGDLIFDNQSPALKNIRVRKGEVGKIPGHVQYGSGLPLDSQVMMIDEYFLYDGTIYLLAFTLKSCYYYDVGTKTWTYVHGGQNVFKGTTDNQFSGDVVSDTFVVSNGYDAVQKVYIDISTGISIAALGGLSAISLSTAKFVKNFLGYCMLIGTVEGGVDCPQRVRWNDQLTSVETWAGGVSGFWDAGGSPDWCIGAADVSSRLAIIKERSIAIGTFLGGLAPFGWEERVVPDVGGVSVRSITTLMDNILFLGWDGPYTFDLIKATGIGQVMRDSFLTTLDPGAVKQSFMFVIEEFSELWICILDSMNFWEQWIYNYQDNTWSYATKQITCAGFYQEQNSVTWADLINTWPYQLWAWSDRTSLDASPITLFGDAQGYVYKYDGTSPSDDGLAIDSYWCTKDFPLLDVKGQPIPDHRKRVLSLDFIAYGTSVGIQVSWDGGSTWTLLKTVTLSEKAQKYSVPLDVAGNFLRFKFNEGSITGTFNLKGMRIYYLDQGPR